LLEVKPDQAAIIRYLPRGRGGSRILNGGSVIKELVANVVTWYLAALEQGGYWLIGLMMALESTIFPLPSELVIPPAAHLAATRGQLSVAGVVIAGALGSWLGAALMYFAARALGRPLLLRYGKYALLSPAKVAAAERWAVRYGSFGVFAARFLPVIRHLIGIPAGIVQIDFRLYSAMTLLGSGIWCSVLAWVGIKAGQDAALMSGSVHQLTLWCGGALAILGALYYLFVHRPTRT
jgi:membrane protein DedA with SNARE-associated domain